ncbi:DUF262 domain-containing protein [Actinopolyspora sp. H202]|uniref:DUF262 domain-containing protein n=1 Tax=Actinopolyspora sp. H202 TaxID=1500456 RepID=UPI003EE65870
MAELVERVRRGEIRVPRLRRAFRWKRADAAEFFDSIRRNYPVGSLLLWSRPAVVGTGGFDSSRGETPSTEREVWVVDGRQRVTALVEAIHPGTPADPRFALACQLDSDRFVEPSAHEDPSIVPLPVLFDPRRLMNWFRQYPDITEYFELATAITQRLRQYPVPVHLVEHDDERAVRDIFDRMNRSGRRLGKAAVFAAIEATGTNTSTKRLSPPIIAAQLDEERRFGVLDEETVLRAVLVTRHPPARRDTGYEFGAADSEIGQSAYRTALEALSRAVAFLQDEAAMPHLALLPFRYPLVLLARFFASHPEPATRNRALLRRFCWRAAVLGPGVFPGGTSGALRTLGPLITPDDETGSVQDLLHALGGRPAERSVPDIREFRANSAANRIILCSWWDNDLRDPANREVFDRAELSESLAGRWTAAEAVHPLIPPKRLPEESRTGVANRVLLPVLRHDPEEIEDLLLSEPAGPADDRLRAVRRSHLITPEATRLWAADEPARFLAQRQQLIHETVADFLERNCEWDFEDTPPLRELTGHDADESPGAATGVGPV